MSKLEVGRSAPIGHSRGRPVQMIDGEPWFVAADAGRHLPLMNVTNAFVALDDVEKGLTNSDPPQSLVWSRRVRKRRYKLIMRSNKPPAQPFED